MLKMSLPRLISRDDNHPELPCWDKELFSSAVELRIGSPFGDLMPALLHEEKKFFVPARQLRVVVIREINRGRLI